MARSLPFEVQPTARYETIGDESSGNGVLKFRVKGSVSIAERLEVAEVDRSDAIFRVTGKLSNRIAKERSHDPTAVYMALRSLLDKLDSSTFPPLDALEGEIALGYTDDLQALHYERTANNEAIIVRQATVMIRRRLKGCDDWTDEDTAELDSEQLIVQIAMLYRKEMMAAAGADSIEDTAKQLEELREALGKLQQVAGNLPPPTGDASTGSVDSTTPALMSSAPNDSHPTPLNTSPVPSKRRRGVSSGGSTTKASASPN